MNLNLPSSHQKIKKTWHELERTKQVVEILIEFSKANECRTKMELSSQSTNEDYHKHPCLL
jgi:ribosomal protein L17